MIETWFLAVFASFAALALIAWVKFGLIRLTERATRFSTSKVLLAGRHEEHR